MNFRKFHFGAFQKILGAALLVLLIAAVGLSWRQFNVTASELPTLDDVELKEKGLTLAHGLGLEGEPTAEKTVRMSLEEAGKLINAELGKDAGQFGLTNQMPVFVYVIRGKILPTGPVSYPPDQPQPEYDRLLVILNAHNGEMVIRGYYPVDVPLPDQVALP